MTAYLWESLDGVFGPPFLVFSGADASCIPIEILELGDDVCWCGWSPSGFMDDANFTTFRLRFIERVRQQHKPDVHLLDIIDNHSSHLHPDQLFTAAVNGIEVVSGPSQLTSAWAVNDDLVNRMVHVFIKPMIETHAESKFTLLLSFVL